MTDGIAYWLIRGSDRPVPFELQKPAFYACAGMLLVDLRTRLRDPQTNAEDLHNWLETLITEFLETVNQNTSPGTKDQ